LYFYNSIEIVSASEIDKGANEVSYVQVGRTYMKNMSIKRGNYLIFDKQRLEKVYLIDSLELNILRAVFQLYSEREEIQKYIKTIQGLIAIFVRFMKK